MKVFRLLVLLFLVTSAAVAQVQPTYFGMHDLHWADGGPDPWPSVSIGGLRLWDSGVHWRDLETSRGVYNWANLDRVVATAQSKGVDILYTFGRIPNWASACGNPSNCQTGPVANEQDWKDFVTALVTRYKGKIQYYELWNEINDTHFWYDQTDLNSLLTMARDAYGIIKSVDPSAKVTSPSTTWTTTSTYQMVNTLLQAGFAQYADIIAYHGYVNEVPETVIEVIDHVASEMAAAGVSKPMWDTEASWSLGDTCGSFCNPDDQAAFLVRSYLVQLSHGIQRFYWYAWGDTWGTLWTSSSGVLKPGVAYGQVYDWLVGATLSQSCAADSNSTYTCGLTRSGGYQALAVWNPNGSRTFSVGSQYTQYRDIYGNLTKLSGSTVTIGSQPLLLESGSPTTSSGSGGSSGSGSGTTSSTTSSSTSSSTNSTTKPDITLSAGAGSAAVLKGQTASYTLAIKPINGAFYNPVTLACTGLPAGATCTFSTNPITPGLNGASVTIKIATASITAEQHWPNHPHAGGWLALWMPGFGFGLVLLSADRKRNRKQLISISLLAILAVGIIAMTGCAGLASGTSSTTSASTASSVKSTGTTYNFTITGTSGPIQHSTNAVLIVK